MDPKSGWLEKLKPGNLRRTINENSIAAGIVSVVIAAAIFSFIWIHYFGSPGLGPTDRYFYDTATHKVLTLPFSEIPPLIGETGKPTVVRAVFLTCSSCGNKRLAYLEKYTKQAQAALENLQKKARNVKTRSEATRLALTAMSLRGNGLLVRSPKKGSQWYPRTSPEGMLIIAHMRCRNGGELKICNP